MLNGGDTNTCQSKALKKFTDVKLLPREQRALESTMALTTELISTLRTSSNGVIEHKPSKTSYPVALLAQQLSTWEDEKSKEPVFSVKFI